LITVSVPKYYFLLVGHKSFAMETEAVQRSTLHQSPKELSFLLKYFSRQKAVEGKKDVSCSGL